MVVVASFLPIDFVRLVLPVCDPVEMACVFLSPEVEEEAHDGVDLAQAILVAELKERDDDACCDRDGSYEGKDLLECLK